MIDQLTDLFCYIGRCDPWLLVLIAGILLACAAAAFLGTR